MAEKHVIEVEARFTSSGLDAVIQDAAKADRAIKDVKKSIEDVGKGTTATNAFNGVANSATKAETAINKTKTAADRLARTKADINVTVKDKASSVLDKIKNSVKGTKAYDITVSAKDKASAVIDKIKSKVTNSKAYNIMVSAKDKASAVIDKIQKKIGFMKINSYLLSVMVKDKASPILEKISSLARRIGNGIHSIGLYIKDHASNVLKSVGSGLKGIVGKTWTAVLNIKDNITGKIRGITNSIFSLKTAIAGIMGGMATNTFVLKPIAFSDMMRNSAISFETMLGSATEGAKMMNEIKQFARTTPLDTTGVIDSVRQMLNSGAWTKDTVMKDIVKIGNAAMASGGGVDAMKGITLALSQMSMTGRVNAQDMMQLANRGIPAWQMLADYFKVSVKEIREMSKEGEITAEQGIEAIMQGMDRYDGMMAKLSKETASGIWSNIKDTFQLSIVEKWGNGLQRGAITGLSNMAEWLEQISPKLDKAGASLEKIGEYLSTKFFDGVGKVQDLITTILDSPEFANADGIGAKMKVLFGGLWDAFTGMLKNKAPDIGEFLGDALGKGIITVADFITGALGGDTSGIGSVAGEIGASFWEAFCSAFDGAKVWSAVKRALGTIFSQASKILPGGEAPGLSSFVSAYMIGSFMNSTGLMPVVGKALGGGAKLLGKGVKTGIGALSTYLGASAGTTALGVGGIAAGSLALTSGLNDYYRAYKAGKSGNAVERNAKIIEGTYKVGGTALGAWAGGTAGAKIGAAIGSAIAPGIGTAIGTALGMGVGAVAGWGLGKWQASRYRKKMGGVKETDAIKDFAADYGIDVSRASLKGAYSTQIMKDAIEDTTKSAEELGKAFEYAVSDDKRKRFGNVSFSLKEIDTLAKQVALGDIADELDTFTTAVTATEQALSTLSSSQHSIAKWNLKTNLGLEISGDANVQQYISDVENYVFNAKKFIEEAQFEATAGVDVLLDVTQGEGKTIYDSVAKFYQDIQTQIDNVTTTFNGKEVNLSDMIKISQEDGIIQIDEQKAIQDLTTQINEIVQKVTTAEQEVELQAIKLTFPKMTAQNYDDFLVSLGDYIEKGVAGAKQAYTSSATPIQIQMNDLQLQFEKGEITEADFAAKMDELQGQLDTLAEGYTLQLKEIKARATGIALDIASTSYADLFGDSAEKCREALEQALNDALTKGDPINWDTSTLAESLGLSNLSEEVAQQLRELLSMIFNNGEKTNVELPVEATPNITQGEPTGETEVTLPDTTAEQTVHVTPKLKWTPAEKLALGKGPISDSYADELTSGVGSSSLGASFGLNLPPISTTQDVNVTPRPSYTMPEEMPSPTLPPTTGTQDVEVTYNPTNAWEPEHITASTTADVDIASTYTINEPVFGPYTGSATATVTITATYKLANQPKFSSTGNSVTVSSYKVGKRATGGFINSTELSWLAEEGHPEVVIPFNPARRGRALDLWAETGRRLGVLNHAKGGIVGDSSQSNPYEPPKAELGTLKSENNNKGSNVSVKMQRGSVQINIKADSSQTVSEAIEEQKEAIAEKISAIIGKALGTQFANMVKR